MANRRKKLIRCGLTISLLLLITNCFAQYSISGYLLNESKEPLSFASVVLVKNSDSTVVAFGLTNEKGKYIIDVKESGNYLLQYSFLGYKIQYNQLTTDWSKNEIVLPNVVLKEADIELDEVSVVAERIPMKMVGDTIQYDAKAFKVAEGSDVEKLLEKMPGIEIDKDGNVTAYGKKVEKIMVDGKEFFGDDPKMATKNIDAVAIDKVEVLDKKSEDAEFTGVEDGNEQKTINLTLKEDYKKGAFGRVVVGAGTEETYKGKVNYNRFNEKSQLSVILNANNINERPFTWQEYNEFAGANSWNSNTNELINGIGGREGINDAISSGINFNHEFNKDLKLKAYYYLTRNDKELDKTIQSENFFGDTTFSTFDTINDQEIKMNHLLNAEVDWQVDSFTRLEYKSSFTLNSEEYDGESKTTYIPSNEAINFTENLSNIDLDRFSTEQIVRYRRKFRKEKRNFLINAQYAKRTEDNQTNIDNEIFGTDLIQLQNYEEDFERPRVWINYTEPLDSFWTVTGSLFFASEKNTPSRTFFDIENSGEQVFNSELSSSFSRETKENKGSVTFARTKNKITYRIGASASSVNLQANSIDRNFTYILPYASARFRFEGSQSLNLSYNTNYSLPSLVQLLTISNNTNSNFNYIGNPNLKPEYTHQLWANYYYFNPASSMNLYMGGNASFVDNKITNQTNIQSDLTRTSTPQNTNDAINSRFWAGVSRPIKKLKVKVGLHPNGTINNSNVFINSNLTRVKSSNYGGRLEVRRIKMVKWDVIVGINFDETNRAYENNSEFDQSFVSYGWYVRGEYDVTESFQLRANYNLDRFAKTTFSPSREFHIINASIRKSFKNDKWAISMVVNDLLNERDGVSRSGDASNVYYSQYNTRSQYFMLLLEHSLGKKKDKKKENENWFD